MLFCDREYLFSNESLSLCNNPRRGIFFRHVPQCCRFLAFVNHVLMLIILSEEPSLSSCSMVVSVLSRTWAALRRSPFSTNEDLSSSRLALIREWDSGLSALKETKKSLLFISTSIESDPKPSRSRFILHEDDMPPVVPSRPRLNATSPSFNSFQVTGRKV